MADRGRAVECRFRVAAARVGDIDRLLSRAVGAPVTVTVEQVVERLAVLASFAVAQRLGVDPQRWEGSACPPWSATQRGGAPASCRNVK
jgi:hypothetical protein